MSDTFQDTKVFSFRVKPGDNASCNNVYRAQRPQILGVTDRFATHFDDSNQQAFQWAAAASTAATQQAQNPWHLLTARNARESQRESHDKSQDKMDEQQPIPVVIDKNTAMFGLQLYWGVGEEFEVEYDTGKIRFRVVGLLANSILQGSLLISEADFRREFPTLSGYRHFLISTPAEKQQAVRDLLEDRLGDQGFDTTSSTEVLSQLLAVQNTYLSTFQSLGAIGLLLGTFGLATVQLRSVLERRGELALMRATGFGTSWLGRMVLYENGLLLLLGMLTGIAAAVLVVLPHWLLGGANVPATELGLTMVAIMVIGLTVGMVAVRAVMKAPVVSALRGE